MTCLCCCCEFTVDTTFTYPVNLPPLPAGASHYMLLLRSLASDSAPVPIAQLPAGTNRYVLSGLTPGVRYELQIQAVLADSTRRTISTSGVTVPGASQ